MGRLAIFIERYSISGSFELDSLLRFKDAGERRGHDVSYIFRPELRHITRYDAVFIRATTDPLNASYVASRVAEMHGIPVIDDSRSILVCCDKIWMYQLLQKRGVAIPRTVFLNRSEVNELRAVALFRELGPKIVLKAPDSSFSSHVEKVESPAEFVEIGERFLRRSDRILAQEFVKSLFDWRVGVLGGKPLFACRYIIPEETFKIMAVVDGKLRLCWTEGVALDAAPPEVVKLAVDAANAIGEGLYGVDLKQVDGRTVVIEVNDNPTINAGLEDLYAPDLYDRIVAHLLEERRPRRPAKRG